MTDYNSFGLDSLLKYLIWLRFGVKFEPEKKRGNHNAGVLFFPPICMRVLSIQIRRKRFWNKPTLNCAIALHDIDTSFIYSSKSHQYSNSVSIRLTCQTEMALKRPNDLYVHTHIDTQHMYLWYILWLFIFRCDWTEIDLKTRTRTHMCTLCVCWWLFDLFHFWIEPRPCIFAYSNDLRSI